MLENKRNTLQFIGKELLRVLLIFVVLVFLLVNAVVLSLRHPLVQTWAVKKASGILSRTIGHQVSIGRVDIDFFNTVKLNSLELSRVQVLDRQGQELFYIGQVQADLKLYSLLKPNFLSIGTLSLNEPHVRLVQYAGTDSLNLSTFIAAINTLIQTDTTKPGTFDFSIEAVEVQNGHFVYDNQNKPRTGFGVDYAHLDLLNIGFRLSEIDLEGDTIAGRITDLRTTDKGSGVPVHDLDGKVTYAPTFWEFKDLNLEVADSRLGEYIRFDYSRFSDFTEFIDSVTVTAEIGPSKIYARDIAQFAPQLRDYDENVQVSGNVKGKVKDFQIKDLDLKYGRNTHLVGNITMSGLPEIKETFAELRLAPSSIDARDLEKFIPEKAYEFVRRLGVVELKGQFIGFYTDFVANGQFKTDLGRLTSDINLKIKDDQKHSSYRGFLRTDGFNLGKLLNQQGTVGVIAMNGKVEGSGFTLETAKADVDVTINSIELNGYQYRNVVTDATLGKRIFDGNIAINDPNLKLNLTGEIDLRPGSEAINVRGRLAQSHLAALKLSNKPFSISTDIAVNMTGLELDELEGRAQFSDLKVATAGKHFTADTLSVVSVITPANRSVSVVSDLVKAELNGNFSYAELVSDIATVYREYELNFAGNQQALNNYYRRKTDRPHQYQASLIAELLEINPVLHLFVPELSLARNSRLEAALNYGPNIVLTSSLTSDTVYYKDMVLVNNEAELNSSKLTYEPDVLASAFFKSETQKITPTFETKNFFVEGVWNENRIDFASNLDQAGTTNKAAVSGELRFLANQLQVSVNKSNINLLNRQWGFNPDNIISFQNDEILIRNLVVANENQSIRADGTISADPEKVLTLGVTDFNLATLNPILSQKMHGELNAELLASDLFGQAIVNSQLSVDSFLLDSVLIGDISGKTTWDNQRKRLDVVTGITRDGEQVLSVFGYYNPKGGTQQLNLVAQLNKTPLKLLEPLLTVIMHDLSGTVDGRIRVSGTPGAPLLKGTAYVNEGKFTLTYLNTVYTFSDKVLIGENDIGFRNVKLYDNFGNQAVLNGAIYHDGFSNMIIDLQAYYRRFLVLNTTRAENALYYGSAVATGNVSVTGPSDNLSIKVNARSEKGTRVFIPLDNTNDLVRQDFIKFVNRNTTDTTQLNLQASGRQKVDLSGISLDFTLDVTDEAVVEIIFDERTGDIIRGAANGQLKLAIDTRGEFNMYGQIEIARGSYVFSLFDLGLITREFVVRPGGTITWNGDPYEGQLNVTATYTQLTSLSIMARPEMSVDGDNAGGRYPVMVLINLTGDLTAPAITLGIDFLDYPPDYETLIADYMGRLRQDQQELNNQVFSLLVLRRLSTPNASLGDAGASGGSGTAIGGSVGDLLSGQLATFLSQIDNNLQVDIMVGSLDEQTLDDLRVRLSYSLLSGRLHVTRQGAVSGSSTSNSTTPGAPANAQTNPAGDWTVEYYLDKDGKYRMRLQYETVYSAFENNTTTTSTSLSLLQTQRFNSFAELFRRKKPRRRIREQVPVESEKIILDSDVPIEL